MNIVLQGKAVKLIDFDAAADYGEPCHLKYSSSFGPPQLAQRLLEYGDGRPEQWPAFCATLEPRMLASVATDMWGFGVLLYRLCMKDSAHIFLSTEADNIVKTEDLASLAYHWEQRKLAEAGRIEWSEARDLVLWCLQTDPHRRPHSFEDVLRHPFLVDEEVLHHPLLRANSTPPPPVGHAPREAELPEPVPEPEAASSQLEVQTEPEPEAESDQNMQAASMVDMDARLPEPQPEVADLDPEPARGTSAQNHEALRYLRSTEQPWADFVGRQARALHSAIVQKDSALVSRLFQAGAVHITMVDTRAEVPATSPVHCAAFAGDEDVMRVLLGEIADSWPLDVRRDYLDQRASLGYTAYMIACVCGHDRIAAMLAAKGCSTDLVNSSGKTGKELLQAVHTGKAQSVLSPFNHGYNLHLSCPNLPMFLRVLEHMLDEDRAAGIRLWHAKQAIYHLDNGQMKELEAMVKDLQAKSFAIALHFTDFASCRVILRSKGIRASVAGQLGGGVSVCLRSLVDFEWGQDWDKFAEAVGTALWGRCVCVSVAST